jgi:hypothetical protein
MLFEPMHVSCEGADEAGSIVFPFDSSVASDGSVIVFAALPCFPRQVVLHRQRCASVTMGMAGSVNVAEEPSDRSLQTIRDGTLTPAGRR